MKDMKAAHDMTVVPRRDRARTKRRTGPLIALCSAGALGLRTVLKKHNASLHAAALALDDTMSAPGNHGEALPPDQDQSTGHASGHRHLPPDPSITSSRLSHRAWRRWASRADRTSHPPRA